VQQPNQCNQAALFSRWTWLAQKIVKEHLATFKQWPPSSPLANQGQLERSLEDIDSRR